MKLYHITDISNLYSIIENGLSPEKSRENHFHDRLVYLGCDELHVKGYIDHHNNWSKNGYVLFSIDINNLDLSSIVPDDIDLPDMTDEPNASWVESLEICGQCGYMDTIPFYMLEILEIHEN